VYYQLIGQQQRTHFMAPIPQQLGWASSH